MCGIYYDRYFICNKDKPWPFNVRIIMIISYLTFYICTISTSERELIESTYKVTPTTTAGPEIYCGKKVAKTETPNIVNIKGATLNLMQSKQSSFMVCLNNNNVILQQMAKHNYVFHYTAVCLDPSLYTIALSYFFRVIIS